MAYFNTCRKCGSNLDPGETCDCARLETAKRTRYMRLFRVESGTGQVTFDFAAIESNKAVKGA